MWRALVVASLLHAAPALAQEEPETTEALPTVSPEERTAAFAPVLSAIQSGSWAKAAEAAMAITKDSSKTALHGEAWGYLGDALNQLDLGYGAVHAYGQAFSLDGPANASRIATATELAMELSDEALLAAALADDIGAAADTEVRSKLAYLLAREHVRGGDFGSGLGLLPLVDKSSSVYADAESLRGIALANQGKYTDALAPLQTSRAVGQSQNKGTAFDQKAALNLGRTFYASENFGQAIFHFSQIDRESPFWPEAQFERAWAHFRAEDINGTLGVLMTHDSPFFTDWYFPEAGLLRAYSLFLMCKFPEARQSMDDFDAHYKQVMAGINDGLSTLDKAGAFADAGKAADGESTTLPIAIVRGYAYDQRFLDARANVAEADRQLAAIGSALSGSSVGDAVKQWTEARKQALIDREGQRILDKAKSRRDQLKQMLQEMEITRIDLLNLESELYTRAAAGAPLKREDRIGKLRKLRARKNTRVWPFQGEYWADELGYFRVETRSDCPESMGSESE